MITKIIIEYLIYATIMLATMLICYITDIVKKKDKWETGNFIMFILMAAIWPISIMYAITRPMFTEKRITLERALNLIVWTLLLILISCQMVIGAI